MIDNELKETLKNISGAGDLVEIYIEDNKSTRIRCEDDRIENVVSGHDYGAGIRVINAEKTFYGSTNDITPEGLQKLAGTLVSPGSQKGGGRVEFTELASECTAGVMPDSVEVDRKIGLVRAANEAARAVDTEKVRQVVVGYNDIIKKVTIVNSAGKFVKECRVYTTFVIHVVASDGSLIQTGYEPIGGLKGFELFDEYDVREKAVMAAERAIKMLSAKKAPSGELTVVLSSESGGTMIHEAIGHSLEADLVQKGISPVYSGKIGSRVSSELITVEDDATLPGKRGSFFYDDEGTPAQKTVLVKDGELKNYMYDNFTAGKDGAKSTGNGRRQSYRHIPIPRMTNTLIAPGKDSPEEIIRSVKKGLFVKKMGGGQVDTANGNFVFDVSESYEIVNGNIGDMVRGATLIGNGPEILKSIDMVGSDLGFNIGTCGKEGQGVPVADAQPTLRIPKITVGGTES